MKLSVAILLLSAVCGMAGTIGPGFQIDADRATTVTGAQSNTLNAACVTAETARVAGVYATNWISTNTLYASATNAAYQAAKGLTNGFVTASITNGLLNTNAASLIYVQTNHTGGVRIDGTVQAMNFQNVGGLPSANVFSMSELKVYGNDAYPRIDFEKRALLMDAQPYGAGPAGTITTSVLWSAGRLFDEGDLSVNWFAHCLYPYYGDGRASPEPSVDWNNRTLFGVWSSTNMVLPQYVQTNRTITVNGAAGTLNSNLSFAVTAAGIGAMTNGQVLAASQYPLALTNAGAFMASSTNFVITVSNGLTWIDAGASTGFVFRFSLPAGGTTNVFLP